MPNPTGPVRWLPVLATVGLLGSTSGCSDVTLRNLLPEIAVTPPVLDFGDRAVPLAHTEEVFILNEGDAPLEINSIRFEPPNGAFSVAAPEENEDGYFEIEKDTTLAVPVTFTPSSYIPYGTELVIRSNDAEESEIRVPVSGVGIFEPLPDIVPCSNPIDFGIVAAGDSSSAVSCLIGNDGDAPLDLSAVTIEGDDGGVFSMLVDPSGARIAAGEAYPVVLTYTPGTSDGDQAVLHIVSNDPADNPLDITLLGNGGEDFQYPVAVIDCPASAAPPEYVSLDGSDSYDPGGSGIIAWLWSLPVRPDGSQASFTSVDGPVSQVFADSAGDYTVLLQVVNGAGVVSLPAVCEFEAIPADALHIELTWDGLSSDIDLHLRQDGFDIFDVPEDTSYCNPFPEWGAAGTDDNPRLDLDDRAGKGPENINVLAPADGKYDIAVHYYDDDYDGLVTATVRVYVFGVLVHEELKLIDVLDLWEVGTVEWPAGTFVPDGAVRLQQKTGCN